VASTNRDFKSSLRSFSPEPMETVVSDVSAPEPHSFTSASSKTQGADIPSALAVPAVAIERLVSAASRLHALAKGSTVGLVNGDLVGRNFFAVSIYPDQSIELGAPPTQQDILAFVSLNLHLLVRARHAFGSWFHPLRNVHVLDVVVYLSNLQTAIDLGRLFDQTSIYDLATQTVIKMESVTFGVTAIILVRRSMRILLNRLQLRMLRNQETRVTVR
jgi:hypothetical protein